MSATTAVRRPWVARRLPHIVSLAILVGIGIGHLYWSVTDWHLHDMNVYWDAAVRLREGGELYGADSATPYNAYRYAPWFAYAWVPLTFVPKPVVDVGWSLVLIGCSWLCIRPFIAASSRASLLLVVMMLPILIAISAGGNVQAPLLALLMYRLPKRDGPIWIALAASLKVVPILLVLYLLAERRFVGAVVAVALTGALWLPILAFPVSATTSDPGLAGALIRVHPVIYVAAAAAAVGVAAYLARRRSPYATLATVTAMVVALPRLFVYDVTWALVGTVTPNEGRETAADGAR